MGSVSLCCPYLPLPTLFAAVSPASDDGGRPGGGRVGSRSPKPSPDLLPSSSVPLCGASVGLDRGGDSRSCVRSPATPPAPPSSSFPTGVRESPARGRSPFANPLSPSVLDEAMGVNRRGNGWRTSARSPATAPPLPLSCVSCRQGRSRNPPSPVRDCCSPSPSRCCSPKKEGASAPFSLFFLVY